MPNDIRKLRRLMSAANHLRKENPVIFGGTPITPSQALKYAWWFESFRAKLSTGVWRSFRLDNFIGFVEEVK